MYLVPSWEEDDEGRPVLKDIWPAWFEAMLESLLPDEPMWL